MSPLPFALLSYTVAVARVGFLSYLIATSGILVLLVFFGVGVFFFFIALLFGVVGLMLNSSLLLTDSAHYIAGN